MSNIAQHQKRNFIGLCLLSALFPFYAFFQMTVLNALSGNLMQSLHLSQTGLSALSTAYLYGDAILLIPAGLILDRYNARWVMLSSLAVLIISSAIFYLTNSFVLAIAARFIAGMAHAFALISCFRLAALYVREKKQGLVMSLIFTIAFLGGLFAQSPFVWLLQTVGLNNAIIIQIIVGILIFSILFLKIHLPAVAHTLPSHSKNLFFNLITAIKNPQNTIASLYIICLGVPFMTLGALYGMEYLTQHKQSNSVDASCMVSLIFIGMIAGSPLAGWLFDRVKYQKCLMMAGVLLTLLSCFLVFYMEHFLWLNFFAIGFFSSAQVLGYPVISANNRKEILSTSMGLANFLIMALLGSLQLVTGYFATIFSLDVSLLWVTGCTLVISGMCVLMIKKKSS